MQALHPSSLSRTRSAGAEGRTRLQKLICYLKERRDPGAESRVLARGADQTTTRRMMRQNEEERESAYFAHHGERMCACQSVCLSVHMICPEGTNLTSLIPFFPIAIRASYRILTCNRNPNLLSHVSFFSSYSSSTLLISRNTFFGATTI